MKINDFLNASLLLEEARGSEPEKGSIRDALAVCYYNMGFYNYSMVQFDKAIQIDAANDFAHYGIGLCLIKENKTKRALGHFKIASFMRPGSYTYEQAIKRYNR